MSKKIYTTTKLMVLLSSLMTVAVYLNAQEKGPIRMQMPAGGYEFSNTLTSVTIPFKLVDNLIVIRVELNGKILNLILDSGMPMEGALLFGSAKVDSTNLNFSGKMPVGGVGGDAILSDLSMGATLNIPNLKMTNQMIIVIPFDISRSLQFDGRDGIIGFLFFANFVVEIDYENQAIRLTKPETFRHSEKGQIIPIEVRGNRIFLKANAEMGNGESIPLELVIDTGNRAALMLNTGYRKELVLPSKSITYDTYGLSKKLKREAGRIRSFKVCNYILSDVLSSFNDGKDGAAPPWEKEGNLGNEILRRFHVTFDLSNKRIILNPNRMFLDPFEFNMAGIQIERTEDMKFIVTRVISNSPSEKASVQIGDKLVEISNRPASQWTRDELENYFKILGKDVTFKIERNGKLVDFKLTLIRLI